RWEGRRNPMWRPYPYPVKHYLTTVQKSVVAVGGQRAVSGMPYSPRYGRGAMDSQSKRRWTG
ncbi:MAG: hypothetical protein ACKV19_05145, partial [Verrucomicrobiales bacterium]